MVDLHYLLCLMFYIPTYICLTLVRLQTVLSEISNIIHFCDDSNIYNCLTLIALSFVCGDFNFYNCLTLLALSFVCDDFNFFIIV